MSAAQAAPFLSWAEISAGDGNAVSGAGINTLDYIAPTRQATTDPLYTSNVSTFAQSCSGAPIAISYDGVTQYLMNPASSALEGLLDAWATGQQSAGHIDAFYFDDTDDLNGAAMPCGFTQATWDAANAALIAGFNYPVIFSGYSISSDSEALISGSQVAGAVVEECYGRVSQPTPPYTTGDLWRLDENLELAAAAAGRMYFCYNNGGEGAASSIALRQYIYASFLLSFTPSSSVLWETFSTSSGLHVFPESQLVPANPLKNPTTIDDLATSSGVYVREYGACSLAGKSLGPCAAVVNSDAAASHVLPALSRSYMHTLALSGAGILDGGSASPNGSSAPSMVNAETGLILLP
ncbi:MAG: hypothetical protein JO029_08555 [Candidatus Eremiobacteraeota bacterium]|nr:hypothetical protein [Candidatus Eremiobacteraeota bacterium]